MIIKKTKYKTVVPCHKKMHFLEEYVLQQWHLRLQQMLLAQKQAYTQIHAATLNRMKSWTPDAHNNQQGQI